jgi:hypothetical protein
VFLAQVGKARNPFLWQVGDYTMADSLMSYAIVTGVFVFLVAILFGARGKRLSTSHGETKGS